jgi:curved DNA-binding protein CbpA
MTELVPQETAIAYPGDLMGAEDEEDLYHILGLEYGASEDEVRDAAREILGEYHPDQGGDRAAYDTIRQVRDILTGEAYEEPEFTHLEEYEQFQKAKEFFDTQEVDEKATPMTNLLYRDFKKKAKKKRIEQALQEKDGIEGTNYHERYQQLQQRGENVDGKEGLIKTEIEIEKLKAEAFERDIDMEELEETVRNHFEERERNREERVKDAIRVAKNKLNFNESYPSLAEREVTDLTAHGDITFVEYNKDQEFKIADVQEDGEAVRATMAGSDNKLKRSNPVHCKVPEGTVTVKDSGLRGTIEVLDGAVELDINSFSKPDSAPVVRAKAPQVNVEAGYDEHGEIYVPENSDNIELSEDNVDLDIAVMEGEITLDDSKGVSLGISSEDPLENFETDRSERDETGIFTNNDFKDPF